MRASFLVGILVYMLMAPTTWVFGRGRGSAGTGSGRGNQNNQSNQPTPEQKAQQKADQLLDDGFAALKAFDTDAALEDFAALLQLKPDDAQTHIGLGLSKAQQGKFAASETEFLTAMSDARQTIKNPPKPVVAPQPAKFFAHEQPDPNVPDPKNADPKAEAEADLRLATYDLAVAYSRTAREKPRALVLIDRLMTETKPTDEMLVNAQRSLISSLDEKAQTSISALPTMLENLETANTSLRRAHSPLWRWGVTWMESKEVTRHRMSRETERLPSELPFLLPDDSVLPEGKKPDTALVNPLLPIVMPGSDEQPTTSPANVQAGVKPISPATRD